MIANVIIALVFGLIIFYQQTQIGRSQTVLVPRDQWIF